MSNISSTLKFIEGSQRMIMSRQTDRICGSMTQYTFVRIDNFKYLYNSIVINITYTSSF